MMHAAGLLQAWEEASGRAVAERALRLVAATLEHPAPLDDLARWSVRRRDAALFDLRLRLFGRFADGLVQCPACDEPLEMRFDLGQVCPATAEDTERTLSIGDLTLTWRLPNTEDLVAVAAEVDEDQARTRLLERCVARATRGGDAVDVSTLEAAITEGVATALAREHADLAPAFVLECPACGRVSDVPFAIDAFLWREVDNWARRTLEEVHVLARAYGWTEHEILSLSPARRGLYLELLARA